MSKAVRKAVAIVATVTAVAGLTGLIDDRQFMERITSKPTDLWNDIASFLRRDKTHMLVSQPLPESVQDVAAFYANEVGSKEIEVPLQRFLLTIVGFTAVSGVALGVWSAPQVSPSIALCALLDEQTTGGCGTPTMKAIRREIREAWGSLDSEIRAISPSTCALSFRYTSGSDPTSLLSDLKTEMTQDPLIGSHHSRKVRLTHLSIIPTYRISVNDRRE